MGGFQPEDLDQQFVNPDEFTPEEGVDTFRTPEKAAQDLNMVSDEEVDVERKAEELQSEMLDFDEETT